MAKQEDISPEDVGVAVEEDHIELVYDRSEDVHSLDMKIGKFREQEQMYQYEQRPAAAFAGGPLHILHDRRARRWKVERGLRARAHLPHSARLRGVRHRQPAVRPAHRPHRKPDFHEEPSPQVGGVHRRGTHHT